MSKKPQGFASLTVERRREIARQGGLTAHKLQKAHRWTSEEAQIAGSKGGDASAISRAAKKANARIT
jgi:general stress protein YciG